MKNKDEIYEKTMELFVERGYDNTPMSLVSKALGLSKAGIYHHIPSKEQLLFLTHQHFIKKKLIPILEEAEKIPDPVERISFFIRRNTESLVSDESGRMLIREAQRLSPDNYRIIRRIWRRVYDLIHDAIEELDKQGRIKDINNNFITFAAIGMMSWAVYWFDDSGEASAESLADCFVRIFFSGVLKEG